MRDSIILKKWNDNLELHRDKFDRCIEFLKANTDIVAQFHHQVTLKLLSNVPVAKHRLYFLFINCLNAAGGQELTLSAKASRKFLSIIDQFGEDSTISFQLFLKWIGADPLNSEGLFMALSSGNYKNFRSKKSALFMRQLRICQSNKELKIFYDLSTDDICQPIPLDVVIADLCTKLLQLDEDHRIKAGEKHFKNFNDWAVETLGKSDNFLLEDLWYWGYFASTGKGNKPRIIGYNDDKYKTNQWV